MALFQARSEIHHALEQAERSVTASGQALLAGNPEQVQSAAGSLHASVLALALALRGVDDGATLVSELRHRLARVARAIAMQREALLRRTAAVDRSVQSLLPQPQPNTYAGALGRYAGRNNMSGLAFRTF